MAELMLEPRIAAIANRNRITAEDVLFLRGQVYQDGLSSRYEVENLFALDGACENKSREWSVFLIEAVCDYAVHQEKPQGFISEDNANWIQGLVIRDGRIERDTELELMVRIAENARGVPSAFSTFILSHLKAAICDVDGPLHWLDGNGRPAVSANAAALVRRALYAMGSEGNVAITKAEAELMFDISDHTAAADNDPDWRSLFVKAIANFMMAGSGYKIADRKQALAQEAFLDSASSGIGGFFSRMLHGGLSGMSDWNSDNSVEDAFAERNADRAFEEANAEQVTQAEAEWLATRIHKDGRMGSHEADLLEFIRAESPHLHPDFQRVLGKVA